MRWERERNPDDGAKERPWAKRRSANQSTVKSLHDSPIIAFTFQPHPQLLFFPLFLNFTLPTNRRVGSITVPVYNTNTSKVGTAHAATSTTRASQNPWTRTDQASRGTAMTTTTPAAGMKHHATLHTTATPTMTPTTPSAAGAKHNTTPPAPPTTTASTGAQGTFTTIADADPVMVNPFDDRRPRRPPIESLWSSAELT